MLSVKAVLYQDNFGTMEITTFNLVECGLHDSLIQHYTHQNAYALYDFFDELGLPWLKNWVAIDGTLILQEDGDRENCMTPASYSIMEYCRILSIFLHVKYYD